MPTRRTTRGPEAAEPERFSLPTPVRRGLIATAVIAVAVALLGGPVQGWWEQRQRIAASESELAAVQADNEELQRRLDRMDDPVEVERVARRELGMVRPGEESYAVLAPVTAGLVLPDAWPFDVLAPALVDSP